MVDEPPSYRATLAMMAKAERELASTIAERALNNTGNQKYLRAVWQFATTRANFFEEMAHNAKAD